MKQPEPQPVIRPVATAVDPGSEAGNGDAPGAVAVVPMTAAERIGITARAAAGASREAWLPAVCFLRDFARPEPETMREHLARTRSLAWVPEELDGHWRQFTAIAGLFHHAFVAWFVKGIAKAGTFTFRKLDEMADRALVFYGFAGFAAALIFFLIRTF